MTTWAKRRDELDRTIFAGQVDLLDGSEVESDVVRPVVPDVVEARSEDASAVMEPLLFEE
jgi:hypothetical protein